MRGVGFGCNLQWVGLYKDGMNDTGGRPFDVGITHTHAHMDNIDCLASPEYVPNDQDILRSCAHTVGV